MRNATDILLYIVTSVLSSICVMVAWQRLPVHSEEVPVLSGLAPDQGRTLLEARGLRLVIDGEHEDLTQSPGTLTLQRPLAGSQLGRGDEVHAELVRAPSARHVPPVEGHPLDAAREALTGAGLRLGRVVEVPSATVAKGNVVRSLAPAGSELPPDSAVDVEISIGAPLAAVPQLVGKSLSRAKDLAAKAGFAVGVVKYGSNDDYDQGVVISQSPASDMTAAPGTKIDVTVND